jgi:hypothetical protein
MPTSLATELRSRLQTVTLDARDAATAACEAALKNLAVHESDYRTHMTVDQRQLRNRLRARGRALGDERDSSTGRQAITHLAEEAAYEHWHRLLFTRFLAENNLLITDEANGNVPVTLDECGELASELGAKDGFELACRFASTTLPGVFRSDDPVLELPIAANDRVKLRGLLDSISSGVFTADDSLGWTYQFWQTRRKKEVNESGKKIGADEISPVTQLFTEDYMVEFLLHNTLGAWWAGKLGPIKAATEKEARAKAALPTKDGIGVAWTYLRFVQDEATKAWNPAAGTFDGWPKKAAEIKYLDPCMGSGHFPVFALPILARLRMEEEGMSAEQAIYAALRDNVHGLELDPRCCQIGAFNIALTAWKLAGYQALPDLHVACCGLAPQAKLSDWVSLAGAKENLKRGMERLYSLFKNAPVLGSLINPRAGEGDLLVAAFHELQPLLEKALAQETKDDTAHEMAVTARGLAKAAEILAGQFTLVATNVPYLGRGKQDEVLQDYCERVHPAAKSDLATCFVERALDFCARGGSVGLLTPQNWMFLSTYQAMRETLLASVQWDFVARLGPKGFQTPMWDFNTVLFGLTKGTRGLHQAFAGTDVGDETTPEAKATALCVSEVVLRLQADQVKNPDARIVLAATSDLELLQKYASAYIGLHVGDWESFRRGFWEVACLDRDWRTLQNAVTGTAPYAGLDDMIYWPNDGQMHRDNPAARVQGRPAWGKRGVAISMMAQLPASLYDGGLFRNGVAVVSPKDPKHLPAIWAFCSSPGFNEEIRKIDQKLYVTCSTLVKIPFDLEHWQKVAAEKYPHGLPKPFSSDPTQWLFNGHPAGADQPLHVAVARLLGYQWPRQTGSSFPDCPALGPDGLETLADDDGIVCLPPLNREQSAATRLRALLTAALGKYNERDLIRKSGPKGSGKTSLEDWLRDDFFAQHCAIFHSRPFIWHLWDGETDGFHALVNYHKLDHSILKKLAYTYLGDWIRDQKSAADADTPGAAERLGAAKKLQAKLIAILEGEAPLDIFVRWKPLHKQPIGWHPDLNDGVRLNIRPFLLADDVGSKGAGLLRAKPGIAFESKPDRGAEPERDKADYPWFWCAEDPETDPKGGKEFTGRRWNTAHFTLARKQTARKEKR